MSYKKKAGLLPPPPHFFKSSKQPAHTHTQTDNQEVCTAYNIINHIIYRNIYQQEALGEDICIRIP